MSYSFDQILHPEKHGLEECPHCSGFGSSLKEAADRCTQCGGSGVVPKAQAEKYRKEALCSSPAAH
jgi:DnaJ-class molecular chaperone